MKLNLLIILATALFFMITMVEAREISFIEDFSLAEDRSEALRQLIPGTSDYYYYHCLHAQHTGDFKQVETLLARWIKREGYTARVKEIINRQALLEYELNPTQTLKYIKKELHLRFDHRKASAEREVKYPTALDPKRIDTAHLMGKALKQYQNLKAIEDQGLEMIPLDKLNPKRRRDLLKRLQRPDYPDLAQLVLDELNTKHSGAFGSLPIHALMLRSQLDYCLRQKPELIDNSHFVNAYIAKLAPSDDIDIEFDMEEKRAFLERLWTFVHKLAPAHNSLKANILYQILDMNRRQNKYDYDLFMTYLRLPRNVAYIEPAYLKKNTFRRNEFADINSDFASLTRLPAIFTDEALVRDYLIRDFADAKDYSRYTPYIKDNYLKELFSETKIVNGLGDMEQWYSMMPPDRHEALKERIDLEFAPLNRKFFNVNDPVTLHLDVKNIKKLIVKIFEINTFNYYRDIGKEVDAAIDLDGLTSTWEQVFTYNEPPLRRVRRQFDLSQIDRPGVFVVEFIGSGKSSRAVIRKGQLYATDRIGTAGHEFIIRDERNHRRPLASLWMAGREYKPDDSGVITIPFTNKPGRRAIILKEGAFCSLAQFDHQAETYRLTAGFHVDREALLQNAMAQVIVRPVLMLNSYPVSLELLENVRLTIESNDIEGVAATTEVSDFELNEAREAVYEFKVPDNLASLRFILKARIRNISRNKTEDLSADTLFKLNGINTTLATQDLYLSHSAEGFRLALQGKNGEPRALIPIKVEMKHRYFRKPVTVTLQTDAQGLIQLGQLAQIQHIKAIMPQDASRFWHLSRDLCQYPTAMHQHTGAVIRIPYLETETGHTLKNYTLLEKRGTTYLADHTDKVNNLDGFLEISGLEAGDYELFLKKSRMKIKLRLTDGAIDDGIVLSDHRILEHTDAQPLTIRSIEQTPSAIQVRLGNTSSFTRLHVMAVRFMPAYHPFFNLVYADHPELFLLKRSQAVSHYIAGRDIGDEYRYILDRHYAAKLPGNMLKRPELLLNPWSLRTTATELDHAQKGEARQHQRPQSQPLKRAGRKGKAVSPQRNSKTSFDFLAQPSKVLFNLKPNEKGVITIDRKQLDGYSQLLVLAADPFNTVYREFLLPETPVITQDLRLRQTSDPAVHLTEQKKMLALPPGETFRFANAGTSAFKIYDTLERIYQLLFTLSDDVTLKKFAFILRWPEMELDEKETKYSKYACHELNFFLFHKDRAFFDSVILPYLKNKKDPTFLDHWLLGDDLTAYLEPWEFERLNIVEKILLTRRGPGDREQISGYVKDRYDLIPPDIELDNFLFGTALKGRALETDEQELLMELDEGAVVAGSSRSIAESMAEASLEDLAFDALELEAEPAEEKIAVLSMKTKPAALAARRSVRKTAGKNQFFAPARRKKREASRPFFRQLDKTREWAENNYYKTPVENQNAEFITVNAFWRDYADSDPNQPFYSPNIVYAADNFAEMMMALAVSDLPFKAQKHSTHSKDGAFVLKAESPLLAFYKEIRPASEALEKLPLSVSQHYFDPADRYRYDGAERADKYIKDEFLINRAYACRAVFSNPSSARRKLEVLLQIPQGALPLKKGFYTRSIALNMEPYATQTSEYYFYFPKVGTFPHYPVQVARNGAFITAATPSELNVVAQFSRLDEQSWEYISQNGSNADVLAYLRSENLNRTDLNKIAFRMRDSRFCEDVLALLQKRHYYNSTLWAYSIYHKLTERIPTFLKHTEYAKRCGLYIDTPLLTLDPVARRTYQHLEYKPLINARTHLLGKQRKILNDRFYDQYHQFLTLLSYRPRLNNEDLTAASYYLLLQDRVREATEFFKRIDPAQSVSRVQYDYMQAYLGFYTPELDDARAITARYADYPVMHWRKRFQQISVQIDEIEGRKAKAIDKKDRDEAQTLLADTAASLDFKIEARQVTLAWQNLKKCLVNYYPMDIELLFSKNPFVKKHQERFAFIRPNMTQTIDLNECGKDDSQCRLTFDLPSKYKNSNLMVEISADGIKKAQAYFANSLDSRIIRNYGHLKVSHEETDKPLAGVYVKVYAEMKNGAVQFYKDGYTDWRGRFDYVSLSTDALDNVQRFAILVLSDEYGAEIQETPPPQR
ncbi:hypothetical protein QUF75_15150 [Desulfococcaceae bacterium HSG7]|nr:hypothetical protein [Desulfococcaceae bacterium HSG7]